MTGVKKILSKLFPFYFHQESGCSVCEGHAVDCHLCGCRGAKLNVPDKDLVCEWCGSAVVWHEDERVYRHANKRDANKPWEDTSFMCEWYGYPVRVKPKVKS